MPRKLHPSGLPEFFEHYGVGDRCEACGAGGLTVSVYDDYGTMPKDNSDPAAQRGVGEFISALVICEECGHSLVLNRDRLSASQAAE